MSSNTKRAMVFIDGNNIHEGLRECFGIERLKLTEFCESLVAGQNQAISEIVYCDSDFIQQMDHKRYKDQQDYFRYVRGIVPPVKFLMGQYRKRSNARGKIYYEEKRADVELAVAMVDKCHRDEFDISYLLCGDEDLKPALEVLLRQKKQVINVYFDEVIFKGFDGNGKKRLKFRKSALKEKVIFRRITRSVAAINRWIVPVTESKTGA